MNNTHCSECGTPYTQVETYPRECPECHATRWSNPIPVAILLQPLWKPRGWFGKSLGLAIAVRDIEPCRGRPALIGGHVDDLDESIESAAAREFFEETGLYPSDVPRQWYSRTTTKGQMLQFCTVDKPMHLSYWLDGVPCSREVESLGEIWDSNWQERLHEIAFPLHREAIAKWFKEMR